MNSSIIGAGQVSLLSGIVSTQRESQSTYLSVCLSIPLSDILVSVKPKLITIQLHCICITRWLYNNALKSQWLMLVLVVGNSVRMVPTAPATRFGFIAGDSGPRTWHTYCVVLSELRPCWIPMKAHKCSHTHAHTQAHASSCKHMQILMNDSWERITTWISFCFPTTGHSLKLYNSNMHAHTVSTHSSFIHTA